MVFEKVRENLADILMCDEDEITMDTEFETDIVLDSVDLVDLMTRLEEDFNITFKEDESFSVKTVGDVVKIVEEKINK